MADQDTARAEVKAKLDEATERTRKDAQERLKGRPTPTQDENDRTALGEHIAEHEDDGSGPERPPTVHARNVEARRPSPGYATRAAQPARPTPKNE